MYTIIKHLGKIFLIYYENKNKQKCKFQKLVKTFLERNKIIRFGNSKNYAYIRKRSNVQG